MDRSKTLREMMKEKLSSPGGNTLSSISSSSSKLLEAKEKAKLLKQVRLQKTTTDVNPYSESPIMATKSGSTDVDNSVQLNSFSKSNEKEISVQMTHKTEPSQPTNSDLPMGFFDDPFADLKAHGLDPKKIIQEDKEKELKNLNSFFNEVKDLDYLEEEVEEKDEHQRNDDEKALQMSYELKLAKLYETASFVKSKTISNEKDSIEVIQSHLPTKSIPLLGDQSVMENIDDTNIPPSVLGKKALDHTNSKSTNNNDDDDIEISIVQIMKKSRRSSINKSQESYENENIAPLDLNDWTSKSIK